MDERELSKSGKVWQSWFLRLGGTADSEVVNATATLVLAERELYTTALRTQHEREVTALREQVRVLTGYEEWHPCIDDKCPHCHPDKAEHLDDICQCGHTRVSHGRDGLGRPMCTGSRECECVTFHALTTPTTPRQRRRNYETREIK
jgi:hypothetical protein